MRSSFISGLLLMGAALIITSAAASGQEDPSAKLEGQWIKQPEGRKITFSILPDQKFQVEFAGDEKIDVWGSFTVSGTEVTFTDEGGAYSSGSSGVYAYELGESSLTFNKVDDPVAGRSMLMEGTWSRAAKSEK